MSAKSAADRPIDFWLDPDMTLWFSIRCPKCGTVHEHKADDLPKGRVIECDCGASLEIGDEEFEDAQRDVRDLDDESDD
jgi:acetone carboxylase gamma subunit